MPKGLKSKQTVTSKLRREANKQIHVDLAKPSPSQISSSMSKLSMRNNSVNLTRGGAGKRTLPPLQKAPGSRRGFSRGLPVPSELSGAQNPSEAAKNTGSRAGSYTAERYAKNPQHERVLFPTQVKESFLVRNKHMANAKMQQMATEFA